MIWNSSNAPWYDNIVFKISFSNISDKIYVCYNSSCPTTLTTSNKNTNTTYCTSFNSLSIYSTREGDEYIYIFEKLTFIVTEVNGISFKGAPRRKGSQSGQWMISGPPLHVRSLTLFCMRFFVTRLRKDGMQTSFSYSGADI